MADDALACSALSAEPQFWQKRANLGLSSPHTEQRAVSCGEVCVNPPSSVACLCPSGGVATFCHETQETRIGATHSTTAW